MAITLNGTTGITTPDITSTTSTLGSLTQALDLGSTGQIVFPATQNASANANTLDDYEEGTWTPTVSAQTGSLTSYSSSATYTKIGRLVNVTVYISITTKGTAADRLIVSNLPFTILGANIAEQPATTCRESQNTGVGYLVHGLATLTTINIQTLQTNAGINWQNNDVYSFTLTYRTA